MTTISIAGVILAGGRGRRMQNKEKATLFLNGRTLWEHAYDNLAPQVDHIITMVAPNANWMSNIDACAGAYFIHDRRAYEGPLHAIIHAMDWAHDHGITHIMTLPVDQPFIPRDLSIKTRQLSILNPSFVRTADRAHWAIALWPVKERGRFKQQVHKGDRRLSSAHVFSIALDIEEQIPNFNTAEDIDTQK